jgi:ABC-type glutathione transport system ATPase component
MLEARSISKTYFGRRGSPGKLVLDDVCLSLRPGETLGLMGPSGSGKSTLARILLRLIPATSGEVLLDGVPVWGRSAVKPALFHRRVQFLSQHPESFFDPSRKLGFSCLEPNAIHRVYPPRESSERLALLLEKVKLSPKLLCRYPHQVSGGEIQRLAICRALLLEPETLILDEPTSMLDVSVQAQTLAILRDLQEAKGLAYLFISHDEEVVRLMSDRIGRLDGGRLAF